VSGPPEGPVLVLGAGSDIARALAGLYAAEGRALMLAGRDGAALEAVAGELRAAHGATATVHPYDARDPDPRPFLDALPALPAIAISAVGLMPDQAAAEADPRLAAEVVTANFTGPALALSEIARRMAARGGGTVIGIGSVAGDRGRARNWWYGASKAGLAVALSGIRQAHGRDGVRVLLARPGFVATRMTAGLDLPPRLTASAAATASGIHAAARAGRHVWAPPLWRAVMAGVRAIPEPLFLRMRF